MDNKIEYKKYVCFKERLGKNKKPIPVGAKIQVTVSESGVCKFEYNDFIYQMEMWQLEENFKEEINKPTIFMTEDGEDFNIVLPLDTPEDKIFELAQKCLDEHLEETNFDDTERFSYKLSDKHIIGTLDIRKKYGEYVECLPRDYDGEVYQVIVVPVDMIFDED